MFVRTFPSILLLSTLLSLAATPARAFEEGMWTYDNLPLKLLKTKYNFVPSHAWLDHLRLSTVRLNDGGSGSFISPNGLLLTNHHVARWQLQNNSTAEHDYLRDGFYAATQNDELKSPDLEVDVLVAMRDVTGRVHGACRGIDDQVKAMKARDSEMAAIEKESLISTGLRSDVVSFYQGAEYWLYQYKVYRDVRLVFAPEEQAAFYGGYPDNFTYPRYDLDMAIFRVYDNGKPIHSDNFLKWSVNGPGPGELVFISGNPGETQRGDTMAQLELERNITAPEMTEYLERRLGTARAFAALGTEQSRLVNSTIFGLENSLKVYQGRARALADKTIVTKKETEEADFRSKVAANPDWEKQYGGAWETIAHVEEQMKPEVRDNIFRRADSRLFMIALDIVSYVTEVGKPDGDRMPEFREAALDFTRFEILSPAPIAAATEKLFMASALKLGEEKLGGDDAFVQAILQHSDIETVTNSLIDGTKLGDPAVRKALLDGGETAVAASTDPMILAARRAEPILRENYERIRNTEISFLTPAEEKLGKARFLIYGKDVYPDANFTLRLSFGAVEGYPYNGTVAPPFTTFYGLYDRAAGFNNKPPFDLTAREQAARNKLNLSTPLNFVCTGDITGGSSGSPVVNRQGEFVGVIFDSNIESLAGDFVYDGVKNRAVSVDSAGMMEGLRNIYGADALADEIEGKQANAR